MLRSQSDPSETPEPLSYIQLAQYICPSQKLLKTGWHRELKFATHFGRASAKLETDMKKA